MSSGIEAETPSFSLDDHATAAVLSGLKAVGHETLTQRIYRELRDFLMEGGAGPGQKLTLRQLTSAFGTSPMPVREAVQRLAAEGALETLPNRSICVPSMTKARFRETRRIRIALEGIAVEEAARLITPDEVARLEELNRAFAEEMRSGENDARRLFRANKQFHFTIYHAARMPVLEAMIENLWVQIGPILHFSLGLRGREATSRFAPECHNDMLRGMRERDADLARKGLTVDIMDAGDLILRVGDLPD